MSVLVDSGRAVLAQAIKEQSGIYLAWGTGSEDWGDAPPPEDIGATALTNEVGRKALWRSLYVFPSAEGEIILPEGRYSVSTTPTRHLYLQFLFDFADGVGSTIREFGVFVGTQLQNGLPPGQTYFVPTEVADPGTLLLIKHRAPIIRSASERHVAEFALTL